MLSVNTNISSLNAQRSLLSNSQGAAAAMERLASGKRINSAKDDAAGLAIASRLESQVKGVTQGIRNLSDATSVLQVAEGGMASIETNLQRIRELAVQAANGSYSDADRSSLNNEGTQLLAEIDRVAATTKFNNQPLLEGTFTNKTFNLGSSGEDLTVSIDGVTSSALTLDSPTLVEVGPVKTISETTPTPAFELASSTSIFTGTGIGAALWRFDQNGAVTVNSAFKRAGDNLNLATAVDASELADGSTAVVALSTGNVHLNIFDAAGNITKQGNLTNGDGATEGYYNPRVLDLGGGEFVVTWDYAQDSGFDTQHSYAQRYDYLGNAVGGTLLINSSSDNSYYAQSNVHDIELSSDGQLLVALFHGNVASDTEVMVKKINLATGAALSSTVGHVSDNTFEYQSSPMTHEKAQVVSTASGYAIFWVDGDNHKLYGQEFDNSGSPQGSEVELQSSVNVAHVITTTDERGREFYEVVYLSQVEVNPNNPVTRFFRPENLMFHRYEQGLTSSQATSVQLFGRADSNWTSQSFDLISTGTNSFDVYAGNVDDDTIEFQNVTVTTGEVRLDSQFFANATISSIDTALENLNASRAEVGAQMNRIESAISTLQITKENSAAAKSRIVDADYAAETARLAKHQILQQASISVLAQANARPEMVLALLRDL